MKLPYPASQPTYFYDYYYCHSYSTTSDNNNNNSFAPSPSFLSSSSFLILLFLLSSYFFLFLFLLSFFSFLFVFYKFLQFSFKVLLSICISWYRALVTWYLPSCQGFGSFWFSFVFLHVVLILWSKVVALASHPKGSKQRPGKLLFTSCGWK